MKKKDMVARIEALEYEVESMQSQIDRYEEEFDDRISSLARSADVDPYSRMLDWITKYAHTHDKPEEE
jgi:hypothetical protein